MAYQHGSLHRMVSVDVGNNEFFEIGVKPDTGRVCDIVQQLWRRGENMHGRTLAKANGDTVSHSDTTVYHQLYVIMLADING